MHRHVIPVLAFTLFAVVGEAADRKFPYEAVVDIDEEYVRSGNGRNYYPTSKLRRGDRVTVRRHDPGGWVMIDPPPGSFSWIKAEHVQRMSGEQGKLTENHVIVRIGSVFNDDHDWYQRELSKGDTVEILGEKAFETDRGPVKMLKIKPPANEYRWMMGKALRPAEAPGRKPGHEGDVASGATDRPPAKLTVSDGDPFADSPLVNTDEPKKAPPRETASTPATETVRQTGPDADTLADLRTRLSTVDDDFRSMIKNDPPTWDLVAVEQQYRQLESTADLPAFRTQVKLRLDAVQRYAKIKQEYEEFVRVTTETRQRDAQLMSLSNPSGGASKPADGPKESPAATPPASSATVPAVPQPRRFDGAGVIHRSAAPAPGGPPYVLTTPGGRLLAYLQPAPGVDLGPYVGQSMGVMGQRSYRQELRAELIIVRGLQPVRLKGGT